MKKILSAMMIILPLATWGQDDSVAARIVDRYLDILNIDALPKDSMLVLNTTITSPSSTDTVKMVRLYQWPQMFRVDVFNERGLENGLYSNGKDYFRYYSKGKGWDYIPPEQFYLRLLGFDFRGPLYNWRMNNLLMGYVGKVDATQKGSQLDAVRVEVEGMYTRIYMFEETGLLSVIVELEDGADGERLLKHSHIDWKCEHEYGQIGESVLPVLESFMRSNELTVLRTEMHFEKRDDTRFNHD